MKQFTRGVEMSDHMGNRLIKRMRRLASRMLKADKKTHDHVEHTENSHLNRLPNEVKVLVAGHVDDVHDLMNLRRAANFTKRFVDASWADTPEKTSVAEVFRRQKELNSLTDEMFQLALPDGNLPEAHIAATSENGPRAGVMTNFRIQIVAPIVGFLSDKQKTAFANAILKIADPSLRAGGINIAASYIHNFDAKDRTALIDTAFDTLNKSRRYIPRALISNRPVGYTDAIQIIAKAEGYLQARHLSQLERMKNDEGFVSEMNMMNHHNMSERRGQKVVVSEFKSMGIDSNIHSLREALGAVRPQTPTNVPARRTDVSDKLVELRWHAHRPEAARQLLRGCIRNRGSLER